jgi:CHASE3 domain sensor protein
MELLNPAFVILLVKITICVVPGVLGIYLMAMSEESKRALRNKLCNQIFGVSNAIQYTTFERALLVVGIVALLLSGVASWLLLIAGMD